MNYIKRLIGLPGETLQIYQGDVYSRLRDGKSEFHIERKPPSVVSAMLQPIHDTDHEPASLYNAGWPLRWAATTGDGWQIDAEAGEQTVKQSFHIDSIKVDSKNKDSVAWLRYRHLLPQDKQWDYVLSRRHFSNVPEIEREKFAELAVPHLIRDFNPYNARKQRDFVLRGGWSMSPDKLGMHWVSDLALRCELTVGQARGEVLLDLVEGRQAFFLPNRSEDGDGNARYR